MTIEKKTCFENISMVFRLNKGVDLAEWDISSSLFVLMFEKQTFEIVSSFMLICCHNNI